MILDEVVAYAKVFSQHIGHQFSVNTIRLTAITGAAASEIGGATAHSEFGLWGKKEEASLEEIQSFAETRMCVIDEISFGDYDGFLQKLHERLQMYTECREFTYGKCAIVFLGDFCQLLPIGGRSIALTENAILWEQSLTAMVELKGTHRFQCEAMKGLMLELREKGLSEEMRKLVNTRVIDGINVEMPMHDEVKFATYGNAKRAEINAALFHNYLRSYHAGAEKDNIPRSAIVIKAHGRWGQRNVALSHNQHKVLFEACQENHFINY